jgi:hypothetical protein
VSRPREAFHRLGNQRLDHEPSRDVSLHEPRRVGPCGADQRRHRFVEIGERGREAPANEAGPQRTRYQLDTTAQGQPLAEAVTGVPLAIRLHSGNFDFLSAQADGRDLRVLAADDKTVLPHRIERFDPANELAVLWVQLPAVQPGSDKNLVHIYSGNAGAAAETAAPAAADAALKLQVRFDGAGGFRDVLIVSASRRPRGSALGRSRCG